MSISRREFTLTGLAALGLVASRSSLAVSDKVATRAIPSSGEHIPIIGLGTNRYGVGPGVAERAPLKLALERFAEWGGGLVDTAPMYRSSENVLGDLIDASGIRERVFLATKTDRNDADATEPQMRSSLDKLHAGQVDLMQIHNLRGWRHSIPLLNEWKSAGRIRYTGITTSRSAQYEELESILKTHDFDFLQINYSLEQQESAERLLPLAADRGMAVIINRAFGGGRLFDAVGERALPDWTRDFGCESWAQFLLKYALSHPATTVVIPGMTKARHVDDNFAAATTRMPDAEERERMERYFAAL